MKLPVLLQQVRECRECEAHLPLGPKPIVQAGSQAKIMIIGQAPGRRVHQSGIPWDDASGVRLRDWMGIGPDQFKNRNWSRSCRWVFVIREAAPQVIYRQEKNAYDFGAERLTIELRKRPRTRKPSHIHEEVDLVPQ